MRSGHSNERTISRKLRCSATRMLLFLIAAIVLLIRMQYILLYGTECEKDLSDTLALSAQAVSTHPDPMAALPPLAAETAADSFVYMRPDRTVSCLRGDAAKGFDADRAAQLLHAGKAESGHRYYIAEHRIFVSTEAYCPVKGPDGKVTGMLFARTECHCRFFSHTTKHTLMFFCVFLVVCLVLLIYNRNIHNVVIEPLEKLKSRAYGLTQSIGAFDFMQEEGDEIDIIYSAFELLRDRQQRLDESLDYAKEIQSRILAQQEDFTSCFVDHGVYYKPLALVSGDFYWMESFQKGNVLVMGDCTGHGIPGALMTMMVISILDSIITEANCHDTKSILWRLDRQLSSILNSAKGESDSYIKHGLDIIVLFIDKQHKTIKLSSASTSLYVVKPLNSVEVVRGQRLYIGDGKIHSRDQVKSMYLKYDPKCSYYMSSDGLFEQIGGDRHIPYGFTRFKTLLFEHTAEGIPAAIDAVIADFEAYKHHEIQRDDITVIGFRI